MEFVDITFPVSITSIATVVVGAATLLVLASIPVMIGFHFAKKLLHRVQYAVQPRFRGSNNGFKLSSEPGKW